MECAVAVMTQGILVRNICCTLTAPLSMPRAQICRHHLLSENRLVLILFNSIWFCILFYYFRGHNTRLLLSNVCARGSYRRLPNYELARPVNNRILHAFIYRLMPSSLLKYRRLKQTWKFILIWSRISVLRLFKLLSVLDSRQYQVFPKLGSLRNIIRKKIRYFTGCVSVRNGYPLQRDALIRNYGIDLVSKYLSI